MAKFKDFLLPLATIAIGSALALFGGPFLATVGLSLLVSGGLQVAAGLLTPSGSKGFQDSPSLLLDAKNHRAEGEVVPIVYGEDLMTPLAISTILDRDGNKDKHERVYLLGWGPMRVAKDMVLVSNGAKADDQVAQNLWGQVRHGGDLRDRITLNDLPLTKVDPSAVAQVVRVTSNGLFPGFGRVGKPVPQEGTKLEKGVQHNYTTRDEVDGVHIVLDWLGGLYDVVDGRKIRQEAGGAKFEYRLAGSTAAFTPMRLDNAPKTPAVGEWRQTVAGRFETAQEGVWLVQAQTQARWRKIAEFTFPQRGKYEIRLTGVFSDDFGPSGTVRSPSVSTIVEIDNGRLTHLNGVELLGVRYKASEQLQGTEPVLKIRTLGRIVKRAESGMKEGWSDNAISCLLDFLRDDQVLGEWIDDTEYDDGAGGTWRTEAEAIESETWEVVPEKGGAKLTGKAGRCNMIVDAQAPARDWAGHFLQLARCSLYDAQGKIRIWRDKAGKTSARTFEARPNIASSRYNVLRDDEGKPRLEVTGLDRGERYNRVGVRYRDKDRDYSEQTAYEPEDPPSGEEERLLEVFLRGANNVGQALVEAKYLLEKAKLEGWIARWAVAWGDIDIVPGQVVSLRADWPQWNGDLLDVTVLAVSYTPAGIGVLTGRQYAVFGAALQPTARPPSRTMSPPGSIVISPGSTTSRPTSADQPTSTGSAPSRAKATSVKVQVEAKI